MLATESYESWRHVHDSRTWGRWPSEDVVAAVCSRWTSKERLTKRVLDLGCGAGAHARMLIEEGFFNVLGVDCPEAVKRAIARVPCARFLWADLNQVDALRSSWAQDPYDLVLDIGTTCCLMDLAWSAWLRHFTQHLAPGAVLIARNPITNQIPDHTPTTFLRDEAAWRFELSGWASVQCSTVVTARGLRLLHIEAVR